MKSPEEILRIMLYNQFLEELKSGKLCASDSIIWILRDSDEVNIRFEKWLKYKGYSE